MSSKQDRNLKGLNTFGPRIPSLHGWGRFVLDPMKTTTASVRKAMVTKRNKKMKITLPKVT